MLISRRACSQGSREAIHAQPLPARAAGTLITSPAIFIWLVYAQLSLNLAVIGSLSILFAHHSGVIININLSLKRSGVDLNRTTLYHKLLTMCVLDVHT
jgi:hypothetical protein